MIRSFFTSTIDFFTDPSSVGFPILMLAGLAAILALMRYTMKEWKPKGPKGTNRKDGGTHIPYQPF